MKKALTLDKGKRKAKLGVLFMILSFGILAGGLVVLVLQPLIGAFALFGGVSTCILTIAAGLATVMAGNAKEHEHAATIARAAVDMGKENTPK